MKLFTSLLLAGLLISPVLAPSQQTPASSPAPAPSSQAPSSSSVTIYGNAKNKPVPSFLILGTVFDEKALSFPGVQVRIRQAGEKKIRWEAYTNSRGEFAVRVPPGAVYEVVIHTKKYADQTKSVDSKSDVQQRLSVQLELLKRAKTGANP
jgi:carboxypeptidase family protein